MQIPIQCLELSTNTLEVFEPVTQLLFIIIQSRFDTTKNIAFHLSRLLISRVATLGYELVQLSVHFRLHLTQTFLQFPELAVHGAPKLLKITDSGFNHLCEALHLLIYRSGGVLYRLFPLA